LAGGATQYEAFCYAFTTVSIGGFAPYNASVAAFDSALIEWTIIVFMLIAGINFSLIFAVRSRPSQLYKDVEFRAYASIAAVLVALVTLDRWRGTDLPLLEALREAAFNSVSLMTTTGYTTRDYDSWSDTSRTLLLLAMFVGGCAGSTAGGVKVGRLVMTLKMALREVHLMFNPRRVLALWIGKRTISDQVARSLGGFMTLFAFLWLGVAAILALAGNDMVTSLSSSLACLSNVGPAMGAAGPSLDYAFFAGWEKLLLIVLMWLGRLEIVAVTALLLPAFWRR
ncbi:MAG: TrkH family potassium uptake protein, partial [Acidobacteriota bacterium]|nr:TrkH family potassium uptake protein [Acidobacteriota bacterium]